MDSALPCACLSRARRTAAPPCRAQPGRQAAKTPTRQQRKPPPPLARPQLGLPQWLPISAAREMLLNRMTGHVALNVSSAALPLRFSSCGAAVLASRRLPKLWLPDRARLRAATCRGASHAPSASLSSALPLPPAPLTPPPDPAGRAWTLTRRTASGPSCCPRQSATSPPRGGSPPAAAAARRPARRATAARRRRAAAAEVAAAAGPGASPRTF
jgi:hypothetical protein